HRQPQESFRRRSARQTLGGRRAPAVSGPGPRARRWSRLCVGAGRIRSAAAARAQAVARGLPAVALEPVEHASPGVFGGLFAVAGPVIGMKRMGRTFIQAYLRLLG